MQSQPQRASLAHPAPALAEGKTEAPRGLPGSCHSQGQVGQSRAGAGGAGRGCGQQSPAGSSPACFLSGKVLIAFLALLSCEVCQSFGQQTVPEPHLASAEQGVVQGGQMPCEVGASPPPRTGPGERQTSRGPPSSPASGDQAGPLRPEPKTGRGEERVPTAGTGVPRRSPQGTWV